MPTKQNKRILIAPMDWGLGHTTRCIPIIGYILHQGHVPVFAGNEKQCAFIEETFSNIEKIHLEGYNISFTGRLLPFLKQIPGVLKTISNEHNWLLQNAQKLNIQGIISDNRYGLYHPNLPSVIMTHQLKVQTGISSVLDNWIQKLHYQYLNRFNETWVVDREVERGRERGRERGSEGGRETERDFERERETERERENLAGQLTATTILPNNSSYIGLFSPYAGLPIVQSPPIDGPVLVLLSGPEPQRSILSNILWQQLQSYPHKVVFVEGTTNNLHSKDTIPTHVQYFGILNPKILLPLLQQSKIVICRSGYSSIMDLIALGKKAILIHTPGQTEQIYLAKYINQQGLFYTVPQNAINLQKDIANAEQMLSRQPFLATDFDRYKQVLHRWMNAL